MNVDPEDEASILTLPDGECTAPPYIPFGLGRLSIATIDAELAFLNRPCFADPGDVVANGKLN